MDQRGRERFHGAFGAALQSFACHVDSLLNLSKTVPGSGTLSTIQASITLVCSTFVGRLEPSEG